MYHTKNERYGTAMDINNVTPEMIKSLMESLSDTTLEKSIRTASSLCGKSEVKLGKEDMSKLKKSLSELTGKDIEKAIGSLSRADIEKISGKIMGLNP